MYTFDELVIQNRFIESCIYIFQSNDCVIMMHVVCILYCCYYIDATQEYIKAETQRKYPKICASGLECVTVLIGLYDKGTGKPLGGIINQPFSEQTETG